MALTKSLIQAVVKAEQLNRCNNCTRFLYEPTEVVERERVTRQLGEVQKKGIDRYSAPELMVTPLRGSTPEEVLGELCDRMAESGFVKDAAQLKELALQREAIVSTAVDNGLAFPHVRGVEGGGLAMAVGISKKGIKFGGPGRSLTRIFFFVVIPRATSAFYLKLIAGLSRTFREKEARDELLAVENEKALWKCLMKLTRKTFQG
jgi:PTS system nitrogen regulatory IIA component